MVHLIIVNIFVFLLDINILALEYVGLYNVQTVYKTLIYRVKLKLEFSILNRLVKLTKSSRGSSYTQSSGGGGGVQLPRIFDGTQVTERQRQDSCISDLGNCVVVGPCSSAVKPGGPSVVMTTEMTVERGATTGSHGREEGRWQPDLDSG